MTNQPTPVILSDEAVKELEVQLDRFLSALTFGKPARGNRYVESVDGNFYFEEHADNEYDAFDLLRRFPALCATVRALRLDLNSRTESYRELEEDYSQRVTEIGELREQLAEAHTWIDRKNAAIETWQQQAKESATRLAQVEQERDDYRERLLQATETEVEI